MREAVRQAVSEAKGNVTVAARQLNMRRSRLYRLTECVVASLQGGRDNGWAARQANPRNP